MGECRAGDKRSARGQQAKSCADDPHLLKRVDVRTVPHLPREAGSHRRSKSHPLNGNVRQRNPQCPLNVDSDHRPSLKFVVE
jgi:hypothetical protein